MGPRRRQHFCHLYPAVLGEMGRHNFVRVVHIPARRQHYRIRHSQNQVRLRNAPVFRPATRRGRILGNSRRRLGCCPRGQYRNLVAAQRRIVAEPPNPANRKPRRHRSVLRSKVNGLGERTRSVISLKRHRRNPSRAMANLAMRSQNWKYIAIESGPIIAPRALRSNAACPERADGSVRPQTPLQIDKRAGNTGKAPEDRF